MPPKAKRPKRTNKPSPLERMMEAFQIVNSDGDELISRAEFMQAMQSIGVDEGTAGKVFSRFDPDENGVLDKSEFFAYAAKGAGEIKDIVKKIAANDEDGDKVQEVFQQWDVDGDGTISSQELERVLILLDPSFTKASLTKIIKAADKNGDGVIDYAEFVDWLTKSSTKKADRLDRDDSDDRGSNGLHRLSCR
eukprot:TRINITY_DN13143_c0_g1_i3.p1 TRINITY_DN13143_c0_g1~~TRINITY_DN13143_c0_g1_i3.p1  ORF type:complete len:193 (-),score=52.95 TRINITY_DN13143_c0_g1_i3:23-601(-)